MTAAPAILITVILILGSYGWGAFTSSRIRSYSNSNFKLQGYLNVPIGFSILSVISGFLLACQIAYPMVLLLISSAGIPLGILVNNSLLRDFTFSKLVSIAKTRWLQVVLIMGTVLDGLGVTSTRLFQRFDDLPAYVYLANKVAVTGTMIDPFNNRRVLSYGSSTVFQSLFVKYAGVQSIFSFDSFFALTALVILVYQVLNHFHVPKSFSLFLVIGLIAGNGIHVEFNLSPRIIITYLSLAIAIFLFDNRSTINDVNALSFGGILGLILSALFCLRPENVITPLIASCLFMLISKKRIKLVLCSFATVFICCAGWAVALYESSQTWIYPLFSGTTSKSYNADTIYWGIGKFCKAFLMTIGYNNELLILTLFLAGAIICLFVSRFERETSRLLLFISAGLLVESVGFSVFLKGHDPWMISRYLGPSFTAVGIFAIVLLSAIDAHGSAHLNSGIRNSVASFVRHPFDYLTSKLYLILATVMVFVVCMGYQSLATHGSSTPQTRPLFSTEFAGTYNNLKTDLSSGFKILTGSVKVADPLSPLIPTFAEINNAIPRGSFVLSAVQTPSLLDVTKFKVSTLDWPSQNSPAPGLNLNSSVDAVLKYLRSIGVEYLLVQSPDDPNSMYNLNAAKRLANTPWFSYRAMGSSIVKWDNIESAVLADTALKISTFGNYSLIAIPSA